MNAAKKFLDQMTRNPLGWQIAQLQVVAQQHGVSWRQHGTSHCYFFSKDGRSLSVPSAKPIKPVYVKKFLNLLRG